MDNESRYRTDPTFKAYADMVTRIIEDGQITAEELLSATKVGITNYQVRNVELRYYPVICGHTLKCITTPDRVCRRPKGHGGAHGDGDGYMW